MQHGYSALSSNLRPAQQQLAHLWLQKAKARKWVGVRASLAHATTLACAFEVPLGPPVLHQADTNLPMEVGASSDVDDERI
jgi:hypothetical protein